MEKPVKKVKVIEYLPCDVCNNDKKYINLKQHKLSKKHLDNLKIKLLEKH